MENKYIKKRLTGNVRHQAKTDEEGFGYYITQVETVVSLVERHSEALWFTTEEIVWETCRPHHVENICDAQRKMDKGMVIEVVFGHRKSYHEKVQIVVENQKQIRKAVENYIESIEKDPKIDYGRISLEHIRDVQVYKDCTFVEVT